MRAVSENREKINAPILLPQKETIRLCQDKYLLNQHLAKHGVSVAHSVPIKDADDALKKFDEVQKEGIVWCRVRNSSGSMGSLPVKSAEHAKFWIEYWRDMRNVNPDRFIDTFVDSGSDILTVHAEASVHLHRTIMYIKGKGIKAGVSLNPTTSLDLLEYILDELFMVVVMTVNPGFEAQPFIPSMLRKIERLRKMIDSRGLDTKIEVDGGIGIGNIREVADAGADIFVTGSSLFYSQDYRETVRAMKAKISSKKD